MCYKEIQTNRRSSTEADSWELKTRYYIDSSNFFFPSRHCLRSIQCVYVSSRLLLKVAVRKRNFEKEEGCCNSDDGFPYLKNLQRMFSLSPFSVTFASFFRTADPKVKGKSNRNQKPFAVPFPTLSSHSILSCYSPLLFAAKTQY